MSRARVVALAAVSIAALVASGCATKKYVAGEVGSVNQRVDSVETQVEDTQTQLRDHDARIAQTGQTATEASRTAKDALDRAVTAGKLAEGKFLYETVLSDDAVKFGFDRAELSDEAKAALDAFAQKLKGENKNVYVEIQGHTDNVGGEQYNLMLGEKRAEAVRRYLSTQGIALHRMAVISYGETEPVSDNSQRDGRSQNRRVVLVVLQ